MGPSFRTVQNSQPVSTQDIFQGRVEHTTATSVTLVGEHDAAMRTLKKPPKGSENIGWWGEIPPFPMYKLKYPTPTQKSTQQGSLTLGRLDIPGWSDVKKTCDRYKQPENSGKMIGAGKSPPLPVCQPKCPAPTQKFYHQISLTLGRPDIPGHSGGLKTCDLQIADNP